MANRAENELFEYNRLKEKNRLLTRYGRIAEKIEEPFFLSWCINGKYTDGLIDFVLNSNSKFIIWEYSEFGTTFFHFDDGSSLVSTKFGRYIMS